MHEKQRVSEMANEVLARQARAYAERTEVPFKDALKAVLGTEAGRLLVALRDGPRRDERAQRWQTKLPRDRARERDRARQEDRVWEREQERAEARNRVREDAAWERFMRTEQRELELRKEGQLAELLGEALPGEPPAALQRLASEDQRQAEAGLVALMSAGKMSYKRVDELSTKDVPARVAANRLRTTWLKERRDGWLGRGGSSS
jgi:hypothetical protein